MSRFAAGLTEAEKRRSTTLGAELGTLTRRQPIRWTVANHNDVPPVAEQIVEAFKDCGSPYLTVYSDVNAVYRLLASTAPEDQVHAPTLGDRCMRAVEATHILGRVNDLNELFVRCLAQLAKEDDLHLPDFRALDDSLELLR